MHRQAPVPAFVPRALQAGRRARPTARSVAPRVASAALRIPERGLVGTPFEVRNGGPQIFVHEGVRQALERRFRAAFGRPVQLAVTDNRRSMITHTRARGVQVVRVHLMFLDAPEHVLDALLDYVVHGDRESSRVLGAYIDANGHRIRASCAVRGPLRTRGKVHDLGRVLARVDEEYFGGAHGDVLIGWGRRTRPRASQRTTLQLGCYSASRRLIRVHPALDRKRVPRYFVSYVVYHELLHHVIPEQRLNGRSVLHSREFQQREREFRYYERAIAWEQANMSRLLRLEL